MPTEIREDTASNINSENQPSEFIVHLNEISPLPRACTSSSSQRTRPQQDAEVLTSTPYKTYLEEKKSKVTKRETDTPKENKITLKRVKMEPEASNDKKPRRYRKSGINNRYRKSGNTGAPTVLTEAEEGYLVSWIIQL